MGTSQEQSGLPPPTTATDSSGEPLLRSTDLCTMSIHVLRQRDEFAIGCCHDGDNATVDPDRASSFLERTHVSLAFKRGIPAPSTKRDHRTAERRNTATFTKPDRTNAGNRHLRLQFVEPQGTVAVRELQRLPSRPRSKARISRLLTTLHAPKERLQRKIEPT